MSTTPMSCEEALRQVMLFIDRELRDGDRAHFEEHVRVCRSCWSRVEFERRLKQRLAELHAAPVRPQLESRIRDLILRTDVAEGV